MEYTHVRCLKDVSDDLATYCLEGKIYEILSIDETNGTVIIICEEFEDGDEMQISINDENFVFLVIDED